MAPRVEDGGQALPATSEDSKPQRRVRRRNRKRDGPPQFQFVTATDPSQFKDEQAKRSVRSQAMIQYRYQSSEEKRKTKDTLDPLKVDIAPGSANRVAIIALNDVHLYTQKTPPSPWTDDPQQREYATTSEAWCSTNPGQEEYVGYDVDEMLAVPYATAISPTSPSRYFRALCGIPLNTPTSRVTDYEDAEERERLFYDLLAASAMPQMSGSSFDPFIVIPQFNTPELNSFSLVRRCNRAFSSPSTMVRWLPAMLSHPHILLSSTIMATTFHDMHAGVCGESRRTFLLKAEVIGYIRERLSDPVTQFSDATLMVIIHLLGGEMWSCNEHVLRIHESGIARLITHRGGMERLGGGGMVAQAVAAVCFHTDLICEATPLPLFSQWEVPSFTPDETMALPESPLFSPREELISVIKDHACSEHTYELLCDMRDLTDLFIAHHATQDTVLDVDVPETTVPESSLPDYETRLAEIRVKLASLPSAHTPGLPTTGDWVYESCRIAAIIYTSAIITRLPLSVAAEPGRNAILLDAAALGGHVFTARLTDALYQVLERTKVNEIWNDMSGVLYWVSLVGAAAARTPININYYEKPKSTDEAYKTWVRRCLIMFSTRTMLLLLFQHPLPIILAQKKMLRVQELLGSGSSRTLVS